MTRTPVAKRFERRLKTMCAYTNAVECKTELNALDVFARISWILDEPVSYAQAITRDGTRPLTDSEWYARLPVQGANIILIYQARATCMCRSIHRDATVREILGHIADMTGGKRRVCFNGLVRLGSGNVFEVFGAP